MRAASAPPLATSYAGFDAACAIEVIEHLEPSRLGAFERTLFEFAQPTAVIITTPNAEYNAKFETLPAGKLRRSLQEAAHGYDHAAYRQYAYDGSD